MDKGAVLAKTAKGVEEIKSRAHGLAQKLRSLLIMVDGAATAGDLLARLGDIPDIEAGLQALVNQGFAEIKETRGAAPGAPPTATASPATPPQTRRQALSSLTQMLHDALGPDADLVTGGIEAATARADFDAAAERCAEMLGALVGKVKAQAFRDRAKAFVEQHLRDG